ncbi:hypothetical protein RFI_20275 [Reticulomyxa filosa]|uniref:Uncharacterized protein n=1 Tax=Reticulomyxa filosa TaxID=46433 RepID=X6MUD3_RETFI|nr:hypothetical protein RFI_20275 [Reticulomyxa filosa]|eukprot:ETO17057.1 hypothetical protein RFI_20275 [Reticulomyxa filosa]
MPRQSQKLLPIMDENHADLALASDNTGAEYITDKEGNTTGVPRVSSSECSIASFPISLTSKKKAKKTSLKNRISSDDDDKDTIKSDIASISIKKRRKTLSNEKSITADNKLKLSISEKSANMDSEVFSNKGPSSASERCGSSSQQDDSIPALAQTRNNDKSDGNIVEKNLKLVQMNKLLSDNNTNFAKKINFFKKKLLTDGVLIKSLNYQIKTMKSAQQALTKERDDTNVTFIFCLVFLFCNIE